MKNNLHNKEIRSFVIRKNNIKKNQENILNKHWHNIGINYQNKKINLKKIFKNNQEIILEIGFGMGYSLVKTAQKYNKKNFIGIEVYKPGIISCIKYIEKFDIKNIRIIYFDAIPVLKNMIYDNTLNKVQLFFPDPWFKKKHNKRRIIQLYFIVLINKKLKIDGILHIITDSQEYYNHIILIMSFTNNFKNLSNCYTHKNLHKFKQDTKFKIKALNKGNKIKSLIFKRIF